MGKYQRATMWTVGALFSLGFLGDVIDFFVFEQPTEINVLAEIGWTSLFLATLAAVEGSLWLTFRAYNATTRKAS